MIDLLLSLSFVSLTHTHAHTDIHIRLSEYTLPQQFDHTCAA